VRTRVAERPTDRQISVTMANRLTIRIAAADLATAESVLARLATVRDTRS
jgi:hypothetical protein